MKKDVSLLLFAPERSALPLATRSALPLIRASASLKNGTQESKNKKFDFKKPLS